MAYNYSEGIATSVVNFFATFEAWVVALGWTVSAGSGTTNLVLASTGESGLLNKLYANVWQDATPSRIRIELRDDAAGTHKTTRDAYLDTKVATVRFRYYLAGDKDAFCVVVQAGVGYTNIYAGLLEPFARSVVDETYKMAVISNFQSWGTCGTVLRNSAGAWDQDMALNTNVAFDYNILARLKTSNKEHVWFPYQAYLGTGTGIAGTPKFWCAGGDETGKVPSAGVELTATGYSSTAVWEVFSGNIGVSGGCVSLLKSGNIEASALDGNFANVTGVPASAADFFDNVLIPFMTGRGWTNVNLGGVAYLRRYAFYSVGVTGNDRIQIIAYITNASPTYVYGSVADNTLAHVCPTHIMYNHTGSTKYYLSGDKDCICGLGSSGAGTYYYYWMGKALPMSPYLNKGAIPNTDYFCYNFGSSFLRFYHLRSTVDDSWTPTTGEDAISQGNIQANGESAAALNSNPSAYDGTTYLLFPVFCMNKQGAPVVLEIFYTHLVGRCKYIFQTSGGGLANLDTITLDNGEVYIVYASGFANWWICIRIA